MNRPGGGKGAVGSAKRADSKRGFYILLAALAVVGAGTIGYQAMKPPAQTAFTMDSAVTLVPNQGHTLGSDTAPVEIIEFADFECPACGNFATITEPDIRTRLVNTGIVRFRFMDFPLEGHPNTRAAHMAAWCAGDQGKFWEMHDAIFGAQDQWSGYATNRPLPVFEGLASRIGINVPQYQRCMQERRFLGEIQANYDEGLKRGVGSTPTFFIGTRKVATNVSYDQMKRYVDEALAQARAAAPAASTAGSTAGSKAGSKAATPADTSRR